MFDVSNSSKDDGVRVVGVVAMVVVTIRVMVGVVVLILD